MTKRYLHLDLPHPSTAELIRTAFAAVRTEMQIPADFPPAVHDEVARVLAATKEHDWPEHSREYLDLEFITIDPADSMDLDQAVHIARAGSGYTVHYAIADVAAFVAPGGAVDLEAHARAMTLYAPDSRTPLHPPALSEGAASLLPDQVRPAAVWDIDLDERGAVTGARVSRGLIRSAGRLSYTQAQELHDACAGGALASGCEVGELTDAALAELLEGAGLPWDFSRTGTETVLLLAQVGPLRQRIERDRGGISLNVPEQEVELREDSTFVLEFRSVLPVEDWNAQISLLTGVVGADMMLAAQVGVLRTLPKADPRDLARLRRTALALELHWPSETGYAEFVSALKGHNPRQAAFVYEATTLFRGAGYLVFDTDRLGPIPDADKTVHHAIGANYAHVTAPLRRLVDRYGTEIALAHCAGTPIPNWVLAALDSLPATMATGSRRSGSYSRAAVDIVEAVLLAPFVGQIFTGAVVEIESKDARRGEVMIKEPAVRAQIRAAEPLPLGQVVSARLEEADLDTRKIRFGLAESLSGEKKGN